MSNPSDALNSDIGNLISGEILYTVKQLKEVKQAERIADQVKNQALGYAQDVGERVYNKITKRCETVFPNKGRTSTSSTSGAGAANADSALKNALSGIAKSFDLGKVLDGDISINTNCGDFTISAGGKFDIDYEKFLLRGDMSALKFSYGYANVNGKIGQSQLNAWVNYSNYSNCSGGANIVMSNLAAQFGWNIKAGEFANQCSISKYSQNGSITFGGENLGRRDGFLYISASYCW